MASDSQTATATTSEKPMENKVNEESSLVEKEIVLEETVDVVKDKPVADSNLTVTKEEEKSVQTPAGEPEKEPLAEVEEVAAVVKAEESTDNGKNENGEKKADEQVELKEPTIVKEGAAEVIFQAVDAEKTEGKGENGEEKVAEEVELKEPNLVKEGVAEVNEQAVDVEEAEGKVKDESGEEKVAEQVELKEPTLVKEGVEEVKIEKSAAEEDNKDKEEEKMVDVSESEGKQVEPVDVPLVREVSAESADVKVLEVEPKTETSENAEAQPEKAKELVPEVEVVKTEETPETTEQAKVEKEAEGDVSSLPDIIEKAITEEKQVVEEPSKAEKEKVSEEAKLATEDEIMTKDTEATTANGKSQETLKETDTESTEGNKQEESVTEKVAEVVETATVAKEIDEEKQEPEVTTKEVKHSRSIMSKVKQSLVKAKKAIIGKSPSSKTITTEETKEEIIATK